MVEVHNGRKTPILHHGHFAGNAANFDCFVSYCSDDQPFVTDLVSKLESDHGLHVCTNARDLVVDNLEDKLGADIVLQRCRKFVVVISPAYLQSRQWDFMYKVTLCLSQGSRSHLILPVQFKAVKMPAVLQHLTLADYTSPCAPYWFYVNLKSSIKGGNPDYQCLDTEVDMLSQLKMDTVPENDGRDSSYRNDSYSTDADCSSYDCFISHCQEDRPFVREMVRRLQEDNGLKVCTAVEGLHSLGLNAQDISQRFQKVILVLTPAYIQTSECQYCCNLSLARKPGSRIATKSLLIPVLHHRCDVPVMINHLSVIDHTRQESSQWFWGRLASSITDPGPLVKVQVS